MSVIGYTINDSQRTAYLFYEFENAKEKLTRRLQLNISLSRIEGTLLYWIDRNGNQLIVTLYEESVERVKIEWLRKQRIVSLLELCGCRQCRYQWLLMRYEWNEIVSIQCNKRPVKQYKINEYRQKVNRYPVIKNEDKFDAKLWLVNTPLGDGYYPNNVQLYGCINDVRFNDRSLSMQSFGDVGDKCEKTCVGNICNGGVCHETFGDAPFCDCTDTFMNGPYCNTSGFSVTNHRIVGVRPNLKLKSIKISWESNSTEIFNLSNSAVSIGAFVEGKKLSVMYNANNQFQYSVKSVVTNEYKNYLKCSLILTFEIKLIYMKFITGKEIINRTMPSLIDLSQEIFTFNTFLNGNGSIDGVYKTNEFDYQWLKIDFNLSKLLNQSLDVFKTEGNKIIKRQGDGYKFVLLPITVTKPIVQTDWSIPENQNTSNVVWIVILSMAFIILVIVLLTVVIKYKKLQKKLSNQSNRPVNQQKKRLSNKKRSIRRLRCHSVNVSTIGLFTAANILKIPRNRLSNRSLDQEMSRLSENVAV